MNTNILNGTVDAEEPFAYNFGSVGFVRFVSREAMFKFNEDFSNKDKASV